MSKSLDINKLNILTYNLHGWNQAETFLQDACDNNRFHILNIQEHWTSPSNMSKFNRFSNYTWFGISAMENAVRKDVLLGRPYGGLLTMVSNALLKYVKPLLIKERLVILNINNYIFINTYLPCRDKSLEYKEILLEILADISNILDEITYQGIIWSGDFNNDLTKNKEDSCIIKNFLKMYDMAYIDIMLFNSAELYTFSNTVRGCYSVIDYICVSATLINSVDKYCTVNSPLNFSDHEPVEMSLNLSILSSDRPIVGLQGDYAITQSSLGSPCSATIRPSEGRYRFDKCSTDNYYDLTRELIEPVLNEITYVCTLLDYNRPIHEVCSPSHIESWYNSIVNALLQASYCTIPYTKANNFKYWWNDNLNILKQKCIESHTAWVSAGKPRSGPIFQKRNADKTLYRQNIKFYKDNENKTASNSLLYSLYNKDGVNFWNTWKNKVNENPQSTPAIQGAESEESACKIFKNHFEKLGNSIDSDFENIMLRKYNNYALKNNISQIVHNDVNVSLDMFTCTLIDISISKLNNSKSVGIDNLQKEHLIKAHPVLYAVLAKLFYLMISCSYVPNQFGSGIIVPIQKDNSIKGTQDVNNFRGITLSPILTKVFEHCLLFLYRDYLKSDDRQFGFKPKTGCVHAIYCARKVIDYFVANDSTVNMCCLDISKAFDNLSHNCLFYRMLKKSVPISLIALLRNWYSKLNSKIKFGNYFSNEFSVKCGVRQGGVISPTLFCLYVDDTLAKLSKYGCKINNISFGAIMYADDLALLAPSVAELNYMAQLCCEYLNKINLKLNAKKSCCIRIGPRFASKCSNIVTKHGIIEWAKEVKYLGITILSGKSFKVDFSEAKCKFYKSFNALYSRMGKTLDINVLVHLTQTIAIPMITYGLEGLNINKSTLASLDFCLNRALFKIFRVTTKENIALCMSIYNIQNINELYRKRQCTFFNSLCKHENNVLLYIHGV